MAAGSGVDRQLPAIKLPQLPAAPLRRLKPQPAANCMAWSRAAPSRCPALPLPRKTLSPASATPPPPTLPARGQLNIPQNGRYVIRTQFAAFAQGSQEAVLNADQPRSDSELRVDSCFAAGRAGAATGADSQRSRARRRAGGSSTGGQRAGKPEPDELRSPRTPTPEPGQRERAALLCRRSPATPTSATSRWPSPGRRGR